MKPRESFLSKSTSDDSNRRPSSVPTNQIISHKIDKEIQNIFGNNNKTQDSPNEENKTPAEQPPLEDVLKSYDIMAQCMRNLLIKNYPKTFI